MLFSTYLPSALIKESNPAGVPMWMCCSQASPAPPKSSPSPSVNSATTLQVSPVIIYKSAGYGTVSCTATFTVSQRSGRQVIGVGGVIVYGQWSTKAVAPGWPSYTSAVSSRWTYSLGKTTIFSAKTLSGLKGNCIFTATAVYMAGRTYVLDPTLTQAQRTGALYW